MRVAITVVAAGLLLTACGEKPASAPKAAPPAGPTEAEKAALLATLPAPYNTADLVAGEKAWNKCRSCHTAFEGGINMVGPNLHGVFGRVAGSKADYQFSDAMKAHGIKDKVTWDYATLDDYLTHPQSTVPGTKMGFPGIKDETERHNLIAYLKVETTPKK
ncbi:cytochrome c family protein [Asticcacaulis sp. YBE204]|uniref:c-type cytochrome n=1 Tax=Asticcacaulis sp. YBE204 TaxID=1282363 RepID=UPI0003C3E6B6|nr:cytochrome c family protein [Asticcacaulis sp. YBE204]ESQ80316.1 hypothetical protein AEYBE204_03380 [Asticcacaulis sp. YBE204]